MICNIFCLHFGVPNFFIQCSNFLILLIKLIAYHSTGSASMWSEAIHSLVDALNQVCCQVVYTSALNHTSPQSLLAIGIARSIRKPDPNHPLVN